MNRGVEPRIIAALDDNSADLFRYFRRRVQPEDAADLLAETAIVAWRRAGDLPHDPKSARRWLFGTARNVLANHQRGERRREALALRLTNLVVRLSSTGPAVDEGAEVRDAIDRLAPELAEVVKLIHWDGLSVSDVAAVTGVSVSTARARYTRARDDLRLALAPPDQIHASPSVAAALHQS